MKNILKTLLLVMILTLALTVMTSCGECEHDWQGTDCSAALVCSKCGETGEVLGHDVVFKAGIQPNCTETGLSIGKYCARCGEVIEAQKVVDALGHAMTEPTCTEKSVCDRGCGLVGEPALGHDYGDAVCTIDLTCTRCSAPGTVDHSWNKDGVCRVCEKNGAYSVLLHATEIFGEGFAAGEKTDGQADLVADFFTVYWAAKSKVDGSTKEFEDGFYGTVRINFQTSTIITEELIQSAIGFVADGTTTVKIWWVSGGDGREVAIYDAEGKVVCSSGAGSVKNSLYIYESPALPAGQYFVGNVGGNNPIFGVEVSVKPACVHIGSEADFTCDDCGQIDYPAPGMYLLPIPVANALAEAHPNKGAASPYSYFVQGKVKEIQNTKYGNMLLEDAEGNTILVYGFYSWNGEVRFDSMPNAPKVGDVVTVYGVLSNYNGGQVKNAWWYDDCVPSAQAPTCTESVTCKNCGGTLAEATGHTYTDDYDRTCDTCQAERDVYTVVGTMNGWSLENGVAVVDGKVELELKAGNHEFKIVKNSQWNNGEFGFIGTNFKFNLAADGKVTIKVVDLEKGIVAVEGDGVKELNLVVAGSDGLCGTNWDVENTNNSMTVDYATGTATKVFDKVPAGNYEFKIVKSGSDWLGDPANGNNFSLNLVDESKVTITIKFLQPMGYEVEVKVVSLSAPAVPEEKILATFEHGENKASGTHVDGTKAANNAYTETSGSYTLSLENCKNVYHSACDKTGKSALKLGTSSSQGSFRMVVSSDVKYVEFHIAMYKAKATKVSINGTEYEIKTLSDNGDYTVIRVEVPADGKIEFTTVSGVCRAMIDKIVYIG